MDLSGRLRSGDGHRESTVRPGILLESHAANALAAACCIETANYLPIALRMFVARRIEMTGSELRV